MFNFINTVVEEFNNGDYKTKTRIVKHLGLNLTLKDRVISIDRAYPWLFLYEANQKIAELEKEELEPKKS